MTNKIDTDMTAAYLNSVQNAAIKANETITQLENRIRQLENELSQAKTVEEIIKGLASTRTVPSQWHPATESPQNDERVIVRTTEGATFMYEPINGKWPKWVVKWMYIPQ